VKIPLPGKDYELKLPSGHLSVSQIETYQKCPEQYRRRYVEKGPKVTSSPQFEGTALAYALELLGKSIIGGCRMSLKDCIQTHARYVKTHASDVDRWDNSDDPASLKVRAEIFLNAFWDQGQAEALLPKACEQEFKIEIAGVPVVGIADVVEENYVFDYKVYKSMRFLKPDRSLQLSMYAHAFQKARVGYIVFLKEGKKPLEIVSSTRNLETTKRWLEMVVSTTAQAISAGAFPVCNTAENFLCHPQFCDFWDQCYGPSAPGEKEC